MAWTTEKLAALEKAMQTGALRVTSGTETVIYRSFSELQAAYEFGKAEVAKATNQPRRARVIRMFQSGDGL